MKSFKKFKMTVFSCLMLTGFLGPLDNLFLKNFSLRVYSQEAPNPSKESKKTSMTILALGDSLTAGHNIDSEKSYPQLMENTLNEKFSNYKTVVINAGISGSTTSSGLSRLKNHFSNSSIQIVLIALGANDGLRGVSLSRVRNNLQSMIDFSHSKKAKVVLTGMKLPINYGAAYRTSFENMFKTLAEKNKLSYIPFLLKGVAGDPSLNLPDRIHPNEKGHQVMLGTLLSTFEKFYK